MTTFAHLPEQCYGLLGPGTVLLQTARFDAENYRSYLFCEPARVIAATSPDEVPDVFAQAEKALAQGAYVAGFVSYECGAHFERVGESSGSADVPLVWFGVYPRAYIFDHRRGKFEGGAPEGKGCRGYDFKTGRVRLEISFDEYERRIEAIRDYISAGDTYQVNFTDKVSFEFEGSPVALLSALQERQRVAYSAYLNIGETPPPCLSKTGRDKGGPPGESRRDKGGAVTAGIQILSFSPELFFRVRGRNIVTRPMKGTVSRGRGASEDAARAEWLRNDNKNRAENVMIVDLLRNDLGRICEFGSVQVEELFAVEQYETLWQMTSTISGRLRPGLRYYDIFKALFPCGSVTGAPKVRSMQIVSELERGTRGVYTGAIGFMSPEGEAVFNVPIRTVVLRGRRGEMGVGSGIVFDSRAREEYQECLLKAEFLTAVPQRLKPLSLQHCNGAADAAPLRDREQLGSCDRRDNTPTLRCAQDGAPRLPRATDAQDEAPCDMESGRSVEEGGGFQLIESILWDGTYPLLALHMERLEQSALHFGFVLSVADIAARLRENATALQRGLRYKVRLLLERNGSVSIQNTVLEENGGTARVALARAMMSSNDVFLQHKTTRREVYDRMFRQAREHGLDDVIFMNERGEITEGAISNVFVEKGSRLYTPPVRCGLLPGVYRRHMLENGAAAERVLRLEDLRAAEAIYICNAVRGRRRVELNCSLAP